MSCYYLLEMRFFLWSGWSWADREETPHWLVMTSCRIGGKLSTSAFSDQTCWHEAIRREDESVRESVYTSVKDDLCNKAFGLDKCSKWLVYQGCPYNLGAPTWLTSKGRGELCKILTRNTLLNLSEERKRWGASHVKNQGLGRTYSHWDMSHSAWRVCTSQFGH